MVIAVPSLKIAYMAVPKAACSSVKAALASIDRDVDFDPRRAPLDEIAVHGIYPTRRFRPHRWQSYSDHWRFTVIRDPLTRILSVYSDRVVKRQELFNSRKLARQSRLPPDPDPDFFFCNIREYVQLSSVVKHHVLPAWLFTGPDLKSYDDVFTVKEVPRLSEKLSDIAGQPVIIPHFNRSERKLTLDDLRPDTQAVLESRLAPEYAYFGSRFVIPFK